MGSPSIRGIHHGSRWVFNFTSHPAVIAGTADAHNLPMPNLSGTFENSSIALVYFRSTAQYLIFLFLLRWQKAMGPVFAMNDRDQLNAEEIARRRDEAIRALNTPPNRTRK